MTRFLADENVPPGVIETVRRSGIDVTWVKEIAPGIDDDGVLGLAYSEDRVVITFDKDFGEMAFHRGKASVAGVLLLRAPKTRGPARRQARRLSYGPRRGPGPGQGGDQYDRRLACRQPRRAASPLV